MAAEVSGGLLDGLVSFGRWIAVVAADAAPGIGQPPTTATPSPNRCAEDADIGRKNESSGDLKYHVIVLGIIVTVTAPSRPYPRGNAIS